MLNNCSIEECQWTQCNAVCSLWSVVGQLAVRHASTKVTTPVVGLHASEDYAARLVHEQTSSHCLSGIHLKNVGSVAIEFIRVI